MATRRGLVMTALLAATLTACAGGGADDAPPAVTPTAAAEAPPVAAEPATPVESAAGDDGSVDLEAAVRAYSEAYFARDPHTVFGSLSERCAAETNLSLITGNLAALNVVFPDGDPDLVSVEATADGDRGTATYRYSDPQIDQVDQPWVREGGSWRYDDC